ncbi:MAG: hypothetical protein MZW92_01045 [Comamonadaceae bacterium]|nr:hypothetical protein [Comamonadaceae bacterium]
MNNLSIAVTAKELKPGLFVVTRQNHAANSVLFEAFDGDFCMVPSRIVAQECIAILDDALCSPDFSTRVRESGRGMVRPTRRPACNPYATIAVPEVWGIRLNARDAAAAHRALMHDRPIQLGPPLRDSSDRDEAFPCWHSW